MIWMFGWWFIIIIIIVRSDRKNNHCQPQTPAVLCVLSLSRLTIILAQTTTKTSTTTPTTTNIIDKLFARSMRVWHSLSPVSSSSAAAAAETTTTTTIKSRPRQRHNSLVSSKFGIALFLTCSNYIIIQEDKYTLMLAPPLAVVLKLLLKPTASSTMPNLDSAPVRFRLLLSLLLFECKLKNIIDNFWGTSSNGIDGMLINIDACYIIHEEDIRVVVLSERNFGLVSIGSSS